jgi:hypothetical protein
MPRVAQEKNATPSCDWLNPEGLRERISSP